MERSRTKCYSSTRAVVSSSATQIRFILVLAILVGYTAGCGTVPKRTPLPPELSESAVISGIPKARFWGDEAPPYLEELYAMSEE